MNFWICRSAKWCSRTNKKLVKKGQKSFDKISSVFHSALKKEHKNNVSQLEYWAWAHCNCKWRQWHGFNWQTVCIDIIDRLMMVCSWKASLFLPAFLASVTFLQWPEPLGDFYQELIYQVSKHQKKTLVHVKVNSDGNDFYSESKTDFIEFFPNIEK